MLNSDVVDQLMNELEKEGEVGQSLECTSKDGKTYSIDRLDFLEETLITPLLAEFTPSL